MNAAYGLGETVVGGEAEVDEYLLSRDGEEEREIRVAHKPQALIVAADGGVAGDGGTEEVAVDAALADRAAIERADRTAVARLAVRAEDHFGFPQDIEWAITGGELFLLDGSGAVDATRSVTYCWPAVNRVDNVFGDRQLICSCPELTNTAIDSQGVTQ